MPVQRPTFVALIPARGGCKRLPRKNLLSLAGKPLLAWTVEAASSARHIDRGILSTDDAEIAAAGNVACVVTKSGVSGHFNGAGHFQTVGFSDQGNNTAAHPAGGSGYSNFDHGSYLVHHQAAKTPGANDSIWIFTSS